MKVSNKNNPFEIFQTTIASIEKEAASSKKLIQFSQDYFKTFINNTVD